VKIVTNSASGPRLVATAAIDRSSGSDRRGVPHLRSTNDRYSRFLSKYRSRRTWRSVWIGESILSCTSRSRASPWCSAEIFLRNVEQSASLPFLSGSRGALGARGIHHLHPLSRMPNDINCAYLRRPRGSRYPLFAPRARGTRLVPTPESQTCIEKPPRDHEACVACARAQFWGLKSLLRMTWWKRGPTRFGGTTCAWLPYKNPPELCFLSHQALFEAPRP